MRLIKSTVDGRWNGQYGYLRVGDPIFICLSSYEEKDDVKRAGFRWNPEKRMWWTNDIRSACNLAEFADAQLSLELCELRLGRLKSAEASRATAADVEIPHPQGLEFYPFQKAGVSYAASRPSTLIGDDMGLGKTVQAIGFINVKTDIKSVLVICPATLKINWHREIQKWLTRELTVGIADSKTLCLPADGYDICIVNYDILMKHHQKLCSITWDLVVADECHRLKNPKAKRSMCVYGGGKGEEKVNAIPCRYKLALTGTPIVNRPAELYPIIKWLDPESWASKWGYYMSRYCNMERTRYGLDVSGANLKNLPELQQRLRETIMVRRLKDDVLTELPPKRRQVIEFEPEGDAVAVIDAETRQVQANEAEYARLKAAVELAKAVDDEEQYRAAVAQLRKCVEVGFTELSRVRHETALAKVPYLIRHIQDCLEEQECVVVMAHHKDVIQAIADGVEGSLVLTGDTPLEERQRRVDLFQAGRARVFVGSIQAAGVGLTLTRASIVVFAELDWVPGNVTQAEDRLHRIGQKDSVLVQHIVLAGSIDVKMANTIISKQEAIDLALDSGVVADEPVYPVDQPATATASRTAIAEAAKIITDAEIEHIHDCLKQLADADRDYARSQNGVGFNKIDTGIGHELAGLYRLTPKQAVLGRKIVQKYRKQLGLVEVEA